MVKKVVIKSKQKTAKKKFLVEIMAPEIFGKIKLGKSSFTDLKNVVGKVIKMNLMYVLGSSRNQNIRVRFILSDVDNGVCRTEIKEYEHISYFLTKQLKSGSTLVEDTINLTSKDGKEFVIKPFLVFKNQISSLTKTAIRKKIQEHLKEESLKVNFDSFVLNVINNQVQIELKNLIRNISLAKVMEFKKITLKNKNNKK